MTSLVKETTTMITIHDDLSSTITLEDAMIIALDYLL